MAPKVFITGATGYIGGDALYEFVQAHPDWEITCSVRNSDKGASIASKYASIKLAYGDLDAVEMIEEEASKADIVYHFANCDHEASAEAIARGLARRQADTPAYWIHTSGTMILAWQTNDQKAWGKELPKVFNDWEGVGELTSQPDYAAHRNVDKIVLAASKAHPEKIKTAIVCPPTIYGRGRGPDNQRSVQAYMVAESFMTKKKAYSVGQNTNLWHQVHVKDLSKLYMLLGEAAVNGGAPATWDEQGYYFAENGEFVWGDVIRAIAKEINKQGLVKLGEVEELSIEEVDKVNHRAKYAFGTNSRGVSIRGKKLLGWEPKERSLLEEVPTVVESEAVRAGLAGHAAQVEKE